MEELITEIEGVLSALREEQETERRAQRQAARAASERINREVEEYLLDSGVFDAMQE